MFFWIEKGNEKNEVDESRKNLWQVWTANLSSFFCEYSVEGLPLFTIITGPSKVNHSPPIRLSDVILPALSPDMPT
jgi:hypothetical protein